MTDVELVAIFVLAAIIITAMIKVLRYFAYSEERVNEASAVEDDARRDKAMEIFRQVHGRARNTRQRLEDQIQEDPARAARNVTRVMNQSQYGARRK